MRAVHRRAAADEWIIAARYADTGRVVIPVDVREDAPAAAFFKGPAVNPPVGLDADGAVQAA